MICAIEEASKFGFGVEVLSNCYWASCPEDAIEWLRPIGQLEIKKFDFWRS